MERIAVVMGKMHSGGKKNLVMEYYRHIDKEKIQFDFICDADSNAIPKQEIESLGGRVYEITPYQNLLKNIRDIKFICKENNYRIIHGYNGTMNIFAMYAGWISKVPVRINESISMAHNADKKTYLKYILRLFSKCFSTHFMSNGEECGRWQFGDKMYDAGKISVFKTVIDAEKYKYDIDLRNKCRKDFDIEDNIVIGHIGRLTEQKNTLFVIDIFNEIYNIEKRAKLLIVGDGNLRESMLDRIKRYGIGDAVLYLGRREDIHQFYNAMDCFLLPSLYEGLPVVGIEAECCGLPMFFSTEVPKESNVCKDIGFFLNIDDGAQSWAEKIIEVTKNNMKRRKDHSDAVKAAGFDSVEEGKKLQSYYERILNEIYN